MLHWISWLRVTDVTSPKGLLMFINNKLIYIMHDFMLPPRGRDDFPSGMLRRDDWYEITF